MNALIGRKKELSLLKTLAKSNKSEFVAVYGRRRVGKTYLIRQAFDHKFSFQVTAIANSKTSQQLYNFNIALQKVYPSAESSFANNWIIAFKQLSDYLEGVKEKRKTIFFDELPWFDTHGSGFIPALEHFWNSWASARDDISLIVCGSAASWMINKLINSKGGLYNRVTKRIKLSPFTLNECEQYLRSKNSILDRYQIIQLYMVLGGIPFYWDEVTPGRSAMQNIGDICFSENGLLRTEYQNLFQSLFKNFSKHERIIGILGKKAMGLTREEILETTGLPDAGSSSRIFQELEECGFIRKYAPYGKKRRNSLYQLVDPYSLFYMQFIKSATPVEQENWLAYIDSPKYRIWSGYAFEQTALYHIPQIKNALGISGVQTSVSSWRSMSKESGAQIDLVIDRRDQVINLCEMKFSINTFSIDQKYAKELRNKIGVFRQETNTRKSVFLTLITTFGLKNNKHSSGLIQNELTMDALFVDITKYLTC